jgi:HAD superfamily hydrolase (TIGR01484 family)
MIKAIILDIDGVIVGEKIGFNSPYPNPAVIDRLKLIKEKGISISLCTAKPHWSIKKIITDAKLDNLHITNGGGVIIDPIDNIILKKHLIDKEQSKKTIKRFLDNGVYTEFYTVEKYFVQKDQESGLTKVHTHILQADPVFVSSLVDESQTQDVVKIMPIAKDGEDKKRLIELFEPYKNDLTLSWGTHPIALPHLFGIITAKGISKKQATLEIGKSINVKPEEMLGIGDSTSDWQFIETCGCGGAMANASEELKKLVLTKSKNHFFIGKSVDENGVLDIFNYFKM